MQQPTDESVDQRKDVPGQNLDIALRIVLRTMYVYKNNKNYLNLNAFSLVP